ncbi:MAG TPA: glycosyltransferase [Gaiellaceae bacterium]|nr:glycosyltransferase [Gaiellaceae bacterium]
MIFVTVGTNHARFDRLIAPFMEWKRDEELVVQHGPSSLRPPGATTLRPFFSYDENVAAIAAARAVITHAGVGSVLLSLAYGKTPIVVARRKDYREAVDDHQEAFAERLSRRGLVRLIRLEDGNGDELLDAIDAPFSPVSDEPEVGLDLAADLQRYLQARLVT